MTNTGNPTPPSNPKDEFAAWRVQATTFDYSAARDDGEWSEPSNEECLNKALSLYAVWANSISASDIEELKAGGTPENFRVIREAFLRFVGYTGPSPD